MGGEIWSLSLKEDKKLRTNVQVTNQHDVTLFETALSRCFVRRTVCDVCNGKLINVFDEDGNDTGYKSRYMKHRSEVAVNFILSLHLDQYVTHHKVELMTHRRYKAIISS